MPANYDHIARIYDLLSKMIYGNAIINAQVCMLRCVPQRSSILIVGGGTGWILEKLAGQYPQGLEIDYIESSATMISLSRQRDNKGNKVNFIHLPVESFATQKSYDVIITPFIFDNFKKEKIEQVFVKLDSRLKPNGLWLYADFVNDKIESRLWKKLLLKVMYLFFLITCGIETQELISMDEYFADSYKIESEKYFYLRFIRSVVYRKL